MQYVWHHRLWRATEMRTVDGEVIQVIDPGLFNTNSGPDFFNAKVKIGGHLWIGNIEIHVRASDWHHHHHDTDPAYDSVILHVVHVSDTIIHRQNGLPIPQMLMPWAPGFKIDCQRLLDHDINRLPCVATIQSMSHLHLQDWITALAYERLYEKTDRILSYLERLDHDWESAAYVLLARALGFGVNGEPCERLAFAMPLPFLAKHRDNLLSLEALLLGQASLIEEGFTMGEEYALQLMKEYAFLSHKFSLKRPSTLGWKMSRMRPTNFPHRRLATLAAMLHHHPRLVSPLLEIKSLAEALSFFAVELSQYWTYRYTYGMPLSHPIVAMSQMTVNSLVINVVVPLQYAYGLSHDDDSLTQRAIDLLMTTPAEANTVVRMFTDTGLKIATAFASQALIQLRRKYCEERKCLYCRIGHRMLTEKARPAILP